MIIRTLKKSNIDFLVAIADYRIWNLLAFQDIRQRYRRSVLGPFWITLSMLISIAALGVVYSKIFKMNIDEYLPYLTVGYVLWNFISTIVLESTAVITGAEAIIKQVNLPFGTYVLRMVWRNLIILFHSFPVIILILVYFNVGFNVNLLLFPLALLLTTAFAVFLGYILGIVCARYRDVGQIINSLMQVVFYVTPVIWRADLLKGHRWLLDFNPFYHYLEILRMCLMNVAFDWRPWACSIAITCTLGLFSIFIVKRTKFRIALWL